MALTRNRERLHRIAAIDTVKKMRLEPFLESDMRRMFKQMLNDFRLTYPSTHETIAPEKYLSDTISILRRHYRRVVKVFNGNLHDEVMRNKKSFKKPDIVESVNKEMSGYILTHSEKQARIIINTTTNDLHAQIRKAVSESVEQGVSPNPRTISNLVSADYVKRINGRAHIIAITETQSVAEKTKDEEAKQVQGNIEFSQQKLLKTWVAILDDDTREWHAEADGQEVPIEEAFVVNGEEMLYPGDPGGSPENIINCRCSSVVVQ